MANSESSFFFLISHCHTTKTRHPCASSNAISFLSRAMLLSIFLFQKSMFVCGRCPRLQECPCQKHPWTKITCKGVFLFIENAFREVLIETGTLLGNTAEFQIQACNERILLISDAAFTFAVSQFGKQLVVIESRLDLKLDRRKHICFEFVLPRIVWRTEIAALDG